MANKKQEKRVLIRQPTLPLFSVPWFSPCYSCQHQYYNITWKSIVVAVVVVFDIAIVVDV